MISGDGWDPNQYANMDGLCLNLGPFQYLKNIGSDVLSSSDTDLVNSYV